jgi:hypothetical protein
LTGVDVPVARAIWPAGSAFAGTGQAAEVRVTRPALLRASTV